MIASLQKPTETDSYNCRLHDISGTWPQLQ